MDAWLEGVEVVHDLENPALRRVEDAISVMDRFPVLAGAGFLSFGSAFGAAGAAFLPMPSFVSARYDCCGLSSTCLPSSAAAASAAAAEASGTLSPSGIFYKQMYVFHFKGYPRLMANWMCACGKCLNILSHHS